MVRSKALERALRALDGLSVGDAFGEGFFLRGKVEEGVATRTLSPAPWPYTDDTMMAMSIVSILARFGRVDQDALAASFAERYEWDRGYGAAMHGLLARYRDGEHWSEAAPRLFEGQGSFGNGAAMRVAPLGAFFADDLDEVVRRAELSAVVTHSHEEAVAGAIAVAVAAAQAFRLRDAGTLPSRARFLDSVLAFVPDTEVRTGIRRARDFAPGATVQFAVAVLGNGIRISAQDTVPYALWCAAEHLGNYEEALWHTASGLGDVDTNCAIVGGVVALSSATIPDEWLSSREPLLRWLFEKTRGEGDE